MNRYLCIFLLLFCGPKVAFAAAAGEPLTPVVPTISDSFGAEGLKMMAESPEASMVGAGSFGAVFSIPDDGKRSVPLAIKREFISGGTAKSPTLPELREKEYNMLGVPAHPNVIQIFEVSESDRGEVFTAMELFEGETLHELMARRCGGDRPDPFTPEEKRVIMGHLASGTLHLHQHHIVHLDLKPENILIKIVNGKLELKITDFGSSKKIAQRFKLQTKGEGQTPEVVPDRSCPVKPFPIEGSALKKLGVELRELRSQKLIIGETTPLYADVFLTRDTLHAKIDLNSLALILGLLNCLKFDDKYVEGAASRISTLAGIPPFSEASLSHMPPEDLELFNAIRSRIDERARELYRVGMDPKAVNDTKTKDERADGLDGVDSALLKFPYRLARAATDQYQSALLALQKYFALDDPSQEDVNIE